MDSFEHLNEDEKLQAENDFLKMKMMLERGAEFYKGEDDNKLNADIESQFLRNIMEFEKQFDQRKVSTVFDKIGQPQHFKPVNEIDDDHFEEAWNELHTYMLEHGVDLSVCSPKITAKELYRFTTEELFEHETDDIDMPGMISGFIYDEFYPDYEYDNTRYAIDDCITIILQKSPVDFMPHLGKKITLNTRGNLSVDSYKTIINQFKNAFDDIVLNDIKSENFIIEETVCTIKGSYVAEGIIDNDKVKWNNKWTVIFSFDDDLGYWEIISVQLEGINF